MKHMLDESWSLDGEWCDPTSAAGTNWVPGILSYGPEDGLELKLQGAFGDELRSDRSYPRVIGAVSGVGACTLVDAFTDGMSIGAGKRSSLVMAHALLGANLPAANDLQFHRSTAVLGNLEEWVGWRPIKQEVSFEDLSKVALRYERPTSLEAAVPSLDAKVSIGSGWHTEVDGFQRSSIVHTARFMVDANGVHEHGLEWHLDVQGSLRDFLTLFVGEPSWFRRVEVTRRTGDAGSVVGVRASKAMKRLVGPQMDLTLNQVGVPFEQLMKSWFEHRTKYETSHHLLFGPLYAKMPYTEFAFLSTVQALEAYVKTPLSATQAENKTFQECVNDVLGKFSPALAGRLYAASSDFPKRVKHTRNYFTHYSKNLAGKAYQGVELYHATERVRLMMTLAFMLDLGVPEQSLRERVLETMVHKHSLQQWQG